MPLITGASSPGDTEAGSAQALKTMSRLTKPTGLHDISRSRGLGEQRSVAAPADTRTARGLRDTTTTKAGGVSDAAKKLLSNGDFAKDFARESKRINSDRGLTKSQRKSQRQGVRTRLAVEGGQLTGDAAEQALDLSRQSQEKGLTSSQRTGLSGDANTLLEASEYANTPDPASDYEQSLLKFFDI
jgi:hypothetical protein